MGIGVYVWSVLVRENAMLGDGNEWEVGVYVYS